MESDEPQMAGPFITVVSVDGGVESGNKLTVITPLELNSEQSRLSVVHEDVEEEDDEDCCEDQLEQPSSRSNNNQKLLSKSKNHGAYVTVLSLGKRDEVGAAAATMGKNKKKSVVNICAGPPESTPHVVAILSKDKQQQQQQSKTRLSSVVDINNESPTEKPAESDAWIMETVTVYKLPGERLGFGLRFDGGVANPLEKVKGLFIQSCAEDSPAARTKASWGHLSEGDEILEIQNSPVANMTRMDCIQSLKEASVALTLLLRHFYSAQERMLRRRTAGQDLCQNNLIMVRDNNLNNNKNKAHELRDHDGEEEKEEEEYAEAVPAERVQPQPQPRLRHSYSNNNVKDMEAAADIYLETPLIINNFTVPVPPPRKLRGPEMEEMNGDAASEVVLSMVKIKPPSGFADDDSSSLFKSHSPTLPPEAARVYTFAIIDGEHKGPYHSESTSMCESDETGSTRSTVVSRLSMLSFNNNQANDTKRTDQNYYGHEGIEGVTTPSCLLKGEEEDEEEKDGENDDDDQVVDGIPLAPPLHFQDGKSEMMGMRRNNEKLGIRSNNNENAAIGKAAAAPLIGNEKIEAMRRDGETIRSNNNNNNDMDSFNPQLIEITDDDELALLAEQLGLDEEEDEAEELRKFLLLEEKIKHIHDKGEDEDDDDEELEDGSSKEDDANVLSTLQQQQQQQWDIDRIAEEDEKEEEDEDDDEKVDTNVLTTTHPVINETTRLTADNSQLKEQTKELIERTNGISGATAAAATADEMTRKTASSSSQGITVTMTQATAAAASQPEKDQDDDEDQKINADEPNFQVNKERDETIVEQHDSLSHVLSSLSVENPHTIQSQDIQWTVKVTSKGALHSEKASNVIANGLDQLDEGDSSAFAIQERRANGPEELKEESIRRRIAAKVREEGSSTSAENIQSQSRPEDTETENNATVEQSVHANKNSEEKDTLHHTINQGQSEESKGMEGSHELYHHPFSPPTFSRLPPDGDEFPNSWSDENKTSSSGSPAKTTTTYDKSHNYRTEIVKTIMKVPPPPVPSCEPPAEEDSPPPPLPSTIPPKVLARRSSSVEDRKKLFTTTTTTTTNNHINNAIVTSNVNNNNNNNKTSPKVVARGAEPSKKSVRDKIAMFSSRTSSSSSASTSMEDESKGTARHVTSSLPRSAAGSALSKSSDNLLSSPQHQPPYPVVLPSKPSNGTWNTSITQSTYDLRKNSITESDLVLRKSSIASAEFDLRKNSVDSNDFSPAVRKNSIDKGLMRLNSGKDYSKLNERSQSMLDVGQENLSNSSSYHRISATYRLSNNMTGKEQATGLSPSSTSLIESRRKANLTKLRGLVIPDKAIVAPVSSSVADLPTIVSKDAVIVKPVESPRNILLSRTESLDSSYSAKGTAEPEDNTADWKIPSLPKYSPAFKRRGLSYQSPLTSTSTTSSSTYKASPVAFNTLPTNYKLTTPEPKSLESLTSPHSDSSFEFNAANNNGPTMPNNPAIMKPPPIVPRKLLLTSTPKESAVTVKVEKSNGVKGKLEDSDNDSAVSSSRSSISHGLSPPNSPTPEESSSTPDPEVIEQRREDEEEEDEEEEEEAEDGGETEDSNSDEGWRVLKPQSVEAINRKNVLASAKFSSGVVRDENKSRRSDDEAGYADGEAEDTESSCSELDVSSHRRRSSVTRPVVRRKVEAEDVLEATTITSSHSTQSSVDLADMSSSSGSNLAGQSPLQAIFDMEVQMAYINEICDALPTRSDSGNRYFSRRDSEATVIERPITVSRKNSDTIDAAERRSRNRSSSGNESDFSSSISVGSQSTTMVTTTITSSGKSEDKWSVLEKKYSKSLTAVNLVGSPKSTAEPTIKPQEATAPVNNTAARSNNNNSTRPPSNNIDGLEKTVTRMMEKSGTMETKVKAKIIGAAMPRGRNDFKSLSEKWQQLSSQPPTKPTVPVKPPVFEKPSTLVRKSEQQQEYVRTTMTTTVTTTTAASASPAVKEEILAGDAGTAWDTNEGLAGEDHEGNGEMIVPIAMSTTKRSVSVNDIRKAFEKAEMAVNTRDDNCAGMKDDEASGKEAAGGLSLPSAHFRVSSFDSTTSEESSATTPAGLYGSVNSLVSSAPRDPYGSITSLASSTSLISPQELQQLIDEANQSLEEAGTPSHEVCVIILHREYVGGSLGITLAGGADYETKEITVHKVLTGSIADRDGRVHRGDRVLSINGKNTKGLTHREALNLLKAPRTEVVLVVSRGRSGANGFQTIEESSSVTLDRAVEPLLNGSLSSLLENDEEGSFKWGPIRTVILIKDGAGLGFSLEGGKGSIHGDKPLTVKKIFVGGPAEKCGELKVGDLIVSISGVNMSSKSRTEAWNFMKKLGDGEVKINVRSPAS